MKHPIDVVIAWVDGGDPAHAAKRRAYSEDLTGIHSEATEDTRFAEMGEVYYCIASVLKFAPFTRRIWIVTDNQRPRHLDAFHKAGLCPEDHIQVVDHTAIFAGYEDCLPTFNSITIETMLWRIPGLAEHFVYFNDDFFVNRPIEPGEWFDDDGKPVLHGWMARPIDSRFSIRMRRLMRKITFRPPNNRPSHRICQELGAKMAGQTGAFLHDTHHPHPMRKSVQATFYAERPEVIRPQVSHRFRHIDQYLPVALANHLEMLRHGVKPLPRIHEAYLRPSASKRDAGNIENMREGVSPFGCIQSLDEFPEETRAMLRSLLKEKFGDYLPPNVVPAT